MEHDSGYRFIVKVLLLALECGDAESANRESVVKSAQEILEAFDDGKAYLQGLFQICGAYCALAVLATSLDDLSATSEKWSDLINAFTAHGTCLETVFDQFNQ